VLKVFTCFKTCASQPQGWHQYGPAAAESNQAPYSFSISPGFWKKGESAPRLARDASRWQQDAKDMAAASVQFQLVTTFNEWGEGTAVESAGEWTSPSGYGTYLDALHAATAAAPAPAPAPAPSSGDPVLAAAGDIACDPSDANFNGGTGSGSSCHEKATSDLLVNLNPAAIVTLGDNQYEDNTLAKYQSSFGPSWGRLKSAIHPGIGNHEYLTSGASGYFSYFGAAAGQSGKGYYSFNVGTWHLVELNSNCSQVGGCGAGSPQEQWLKADLAAHPSQCTLAYWHHPRWSSGEHGNFASMDPIWRDLYNAGVEIVLNGHDHDYERFAPQDPNGVADPAHGIREWVIGTGGKNHYGFTFPSGIANSQVRNADTFGVLKLTLHPSSYDFQFLPEPGKTFTDSGSGTCH
jgi:acid phosphatase type 7